LSTSKLIGKYDKMIDRESAFERLSTITAETGAPGDAGGGLLGSIGGFINIFFGKTDKKRLSPAELAMRSAVQSAARSAGTQIAKRILRGVLGGMSR
jgi:hypothetical protein